MGSLLKALAALNTDGQSWGDLGAQLMWGIEMWGSWGSPSPAPSAPRKHQQTARVLTSLEKKPPSRTWDGTCPFPGCWRWDTVLILPLFMPLGFDDEMCW